MSDVHLTDEHVLVVGAGIMGLAIARQLPRDGRSVVVLEKDEPGAGATTVAGGMLGLTAEVHFGQRDLLSLQKKSRRAYPTFAEGLVEETGIEVAYRSASTMVVARDRDDVEALQRVFDYQQSVGLEARWLDEDEIQQRVPGLRGVGRAVECPEDHFVDPERLVEALVESCESRGVEIVTGAQVEAVIGDDEARGVEVADGRTFYAPRTVVCAGTWSTQIKGVPEFQRPVLRPVRGQVITVGGGPPPRLDRVVRSPDVYLVPRSDGRVVVGSTMEEKGFDSDVTVGAVRELLEEAWRILPGIDEWTVEGLRTGFRPVSLDDRPLIGPSARDGLFLATGHGRHGILLAPVTAQMTSRRIAEPDRKVGDESSFDPRRFSG